MTIGLFIDILKGIKYLFKNSSEEWLWYLNILRKSLVNVLF